MAGLTSYPIPFNRIPAYSWGFVLVIADSVLWPFHPIIATFHFLRAIFLSCLAFVNRAEVRKGHNP